MGTAPPTKNRWLSAFLAGCLVLSLVAFFPAPAKAAVSRDSFEACLLKGVNDARIAAGLVPVQMATDLVPQVRDWSEWMRFNTFKHMTSEVRNQILPSDWTIWAENIAMHGNSDLSSCDAMHQLWMNSPGHLANILNSSVRFVAIGTYHDSSGWWGTQLFFNASGYQPSGCSVNCDDEIFFYRTDGLFRYYDVGPTGAIGSPLNAGSKYTKDWSAITAIDLNGDGRDEMFFYREDGLFRFYSMRSGGATDSLIRSGESYTAGWDSITAVDLDGDQRDEIFFYRKDGLYRYYDIGSTGAIGSPIRAGDEYTRGWDSITAIDLDGDGKDEIFFYRKDGLYRYYDINPNGTIGSPIRAGSNYTTGWDVITSVSLD